MAEGGTRWAFRSLPTQFWDFMVPWKVGGHQSWRGEAMLGHQLKQLPART